jgi:hypothetical protein
VTQPGTLPLAKTLRDAGYETAYHGKWHVGETRIKRSASWHGFDTFDGGSRDTGTRERVVDFIRQKHDKPFFLITSFMNPHDACDLARNMSGIKDDYKDLPVDVNVDVDLLPPLLANFEIPKNEAEGFSLRRNAKRGTKALRNTPPKTGRNANGDSTFTATIAFCSKIPTVISICFIQLPVKMHSESST